MTRILIPLITLGLFSILASYSYGRYEPGHRQSYRHAQAVHLVRQQAYAWRTHTAAQLAQVWGITPQELDSPVDIWGEKPVKHTKGRRHG